MQEQYRTHLSLPVVLEVGTEITSIHKILSFVLMQY